MAVTFQFSVVAGIGLRNNAVGSLAWKVSTTALVSLVVSLGSLVTFYVCWMNFYSPGTCNFTLHVATLRAVLLCRLSCLGFTMPSSSCMKHEAVRDMTKHCGVSDSTFSFR